MVVFGVLREEFFQSERYIDVILLTDIRHKVLCVLCG